MKNEIIIYQVNEFSTRLEVRIEEETVWLNRHQLSMLFGRDVKTIGKHIANVLKEELKDFSVVANFATTEKSLSSSFKTFAMCLPIVFTSLPNNIDN